MVLSINDIVWEGSSCCNCHKQGRIKLSPTRDLLVELVNDTYIVYFVQDGLLDTTVGLIRNLSEDDLSELLKDYDK